MIAAGIEADDLVAVFLEFLHGAGDIRCAGDRQAGRGASRGAPRHRGDRSRTALWDDHAIASKSGHGTDDGAQVARIGDVIQDDEHAGARVLGGVGNQILHRGVLIRRDLQADALVHAISRHAVHLVALNLDDGDIAGIAHGHGLRKPLIVARSGSDVKRGGRHLGVQTLDDRVAAHHHLCGFFLVAPRVAALALQLRLVLGVVDAVLGLRGGSLAF